MPAPEIQQLNSPPSLDKPVTCVLIDGSITYSADLRSQAEMAFTLPTPVGESPPFYLLSYKGTPYYYVHFHGVDFTTASKNVQVGFTGTWYVIHKLGVRDAISGAAAGSIHPDMKPGDLVVMDDFVDFSTHRPRSMLTEIWERPPWIGAQYVPPLCPELTNIIRQCAKSYTRGKVFETGTFGQFEGHRFESPGEIRMAKAVGADMVAHHQSSEAIYARELGVHYGAIDYITNIAAGLSSAEEAFVSDAEAKLGYEQCKNIMLEAIILASQRTPACTVCPQCDEQPVDVKNVTAKPVYR